MEDSPKCHWFYYDRDTSKYKPYPLDISDKIEEAYQLKEKTIELPSLHAFIDFQTMKENTTAHRFTTMLYIKDVIRATWFWKDENNCWAPYDANICKLLEESHNTGNFTEVLVSAKPKRVVQRFSNGSYRQIRHTKKATKEGREVERGYPITTKEIGGIGNSNTRAGLFGQLFNIIGTTGSDYIRVTGHFEIKDIQILENSWKEFYERHPPSDTSSSNPSLLPEHITLNFRQFCDALGIMGYCENELNSPLTREAANPLFLPHWLFGVLLPPFRFATTKTELRLKDFLKNMSTLLRGSHPECRQWAFKSLINLEPPTTSTNLTTNSTTSTTTDITISTTTDFTTSTTTDSTIRTTTDITTSATTDSTISTTDITTNATTDSTISTTTDITTNATTDSIISNFTILSSSDPTNNLTDSTEPTVGESLFLPPSALYAALELIENMLKNLGLNSTLLRKKSERVKVILDQHPLLKSGPISCDVYRSISDDIIKAYLKGDTPTPIHPRQKVAWSLHLLHGDFNLALNLALAIQRAVERSSSSDLPSNITTADTGESTMFQLPVIPDHELLKTPIHQPSITHRSGPSQTVFYTVTDYAPQVFRAIRHHFNVTDDDYLCALGIEPLLVNLVIGGQLNSYQQVGSYGKSGSIFYYTHDALFMVKTVSDKEGVRLLECLLPYYRHVTKGKSLILPYLGLHRIECKKTNKSMYVCVMKNLFCSSNKIDEIFDLKGSTYGRMVEEKKPGVPLKDLDFVDRILYVAGTVKDTIVEQINRDVEFLSNVMETMDYSLLLGIHHVKPDTYGYLNEGEVSGDGGYFSKDRKELYYMGIIDYLVGFDLWKKTEVMIKGFKVSKDQISAMEPKKICKPFQYLFPRKN